MELDDRGYIPVDEHMRTSAEGIYAIGDVVPTPWLAHVASAEGIVAVETIAGVETRALDYEQVPSVTYCEPEVGSVGLSEAQARERGYDVAVGKFPFSASGKAAIEGKTLGFVKVVRETRYDQLLGVHIIGPKATDLIAEACVALKVSRPPRSFSEPFTRIRPCRRRWPRRPTPPVATRSTSSGRGVENGH